LGAVLRIQSGGNNQAQPLLAGTEHGEQAANFSDILARMQAQHDRQQQYEKENNGRCLPQQENENGKQAYARCEIGAQQAMDASDDSRIKKWWNGTEHYLPQQDRANFEANQNANDKERDRGAAAAFGQSVAGMVTGNASDVAISGYMYANRTDSNQEWADVVRENLENRKATDRIHPVASWAGTVTGVAAVVGTGAAVRAAGSGTAVAAEVASTATSSFRAGAKVGSVYGAIAGASGNHDSLEHAACGGAEGLGIGFLMGGAGNVVVHLAVKVAGPTIQSAAAAL